MLNLVGVGAVVLYLLPLVVLWLINARRNRPLWEIALDIPYVPMGGKAVHCEPTWEQRASLLRTLR